MKLLVIEDEPKIRSYLKKGLEQLGYVVDTADNGIDGLHLLHEYEYDVAILDIMLPKMDGWEVLANIRKTKDLPILILSARDQVDERVHGLENGADDYLIKPFSFSELVARIKLIVKRKSQTTIKNHASSSKSVGHWWLGQPPKLVI